MPALSRRAALGASAAVLPLAASVPPSRQPAPAAAAVDAACPAAAIGRRLAVLEVEHAKADEAAVRGDPVSKAAGAQRFEALDAEMERLANALATTQARSLPGAMAQVMVATSLALGGDMTEIGRAKFAGLMLSAVNTVERFGGARREEMAGDYYMPRDNDGARGKPDGTVVPPLDAGLMAMADEVIRLDGVYKAKGAFLDDLLDDISGEEAARLETAFYAEATQAMNLAHRMAETRAFTTAGVEAKARVAMTYEREHEGWDKEEVYLLGRSLAEDIERGALFGREDGA